VTATLHRLFFDQLKLCAVSSGQLVGVIAEAGHKGAYHWGALEVYDPLTLYGQEARSVAGNFMWSTDSNRFANRETPAHLDIPMRGCTVRVDDTVVVRDGRLVA